MHQYRDRRATLRGKRVAFAVAAAFLPWGHAYALPTGENVVHGDVTVTRPTTELMQINQGTQKGIVNWQGFSIGASEHVNITQPNAGASLLNRVVGNNPSEIFGRLTANGQVFLVNNAGVLFAPSASVEVGSLVASTLSITDQNFLNNNYQFSNPGNAGSVVNQGSIITANGYTALIGPQVRNDGVILAQSGKVALGAGDRVTLDMVGDGLISISVDEAAFNASVVNTGTLQADGGTVMLKAQSANALLDTVINTSGVIRANALVERNGEIVLDGGGAGVVAVSGTLQAPSIKVVGDKVGLLDGARVDASGNAGGGTVLANGNALYVAADASVTADALQSGDGGRIILKSSDSTQIHGAVSARGAGEGSGGFVETSGGYLEITRAPELGAGGTWLIDPYNITVVAVAVPPSNNSGAPSFTPTGNDSQVEAGMINTQLTAGVNVVLDTSGAGTQPGNITVNAPISKFALNPASLTFDADNNVAINASINLFQGAFNVTAGGNMSVNNLVTTGSNLAPGTQSISVAGNLSVVGNPGAPALLTANGGQIITARSIDVRSQGAFAQISNQTSGNQTITASGGSIDVQTLTPGGNAFIANLAAGTQTITVQNGDHLNVKGNFGVAGIQAGNGTQNISVTGSSSANAINIGNLGAGGASQVTARRQTITAGTGTQQGSITIAGSGLPSTFTGISSSNIAGNTQTIATSGTITITGGTAPNAAPPPPAVPPSSNAGIFHNSNGLQKITASGITLQGGLAGNGNAAFISSSGGGVPANAGNQEINVAGGNISITGGAVGSNNRAGFSTTANQTINGNPNITLTGGASGGATGSNNAFITAGAGKLQTINAGTITMTSGAGGTDNSATITGETQVITTTGDVLLTGGAGGGTANGVRIGGLAGAAPTTTNLTLNVGGDLVMTGGSAANNGAALGSSVIAADKANNITVNALSGDVILNSGTGAGVRIGTTLQGDPPPAAGTIAITAGGSIQLNGDAHPAAIRTTGDVTLRANGGAIVEGPNGYILGNLLTTSSNGSTSLTGPNRVQRLHATTFTGDFVFNNTGALEVLQVDVGDVSFTNVGSVTVNGLWNSSATSITTTGLGSDLTVNNNIISAVGPMSVDVSGALVVNGSSQHAGLTSFGPSASQDITAHSISLTGQNGWRANIENRDAGNQSISATAGDMNLQVPGGFGVAQIVNTAPGGNQTISVSGQLNVLGGVISPTPTGSRNSGLFKQAPGGVQTVSAAGITLQGASSGTMAGALINSQGDQLVDVTGGTINLIGGSGGITNNAVIAASPTGQQTVLAHDINMRNGVGGRDTVAGIFGGHQLIDATGNVTLTSEAAILGTAPGGPGVRIGAPGASTTGTDLTLLVGGNLTLNGGSAVENGAAIGSSGAVLPPLQNTIHIEAGGNVILNAGNASNTGVRIGSGSSGTAGGNISIEAGGSIELNGTARSAAIRTLDTVTLVADRIIETGNGFVIAGTLNTATTGNASLTGPNQVSNFSASSAAGDVVLNNTAPLLTVTSITAQGISISQSGALDVVGNVTSTGAQTISATGDITIGADGNAVEVRAGGPITMSSGGDLAVAAGSAEGAHALVFSSADINLTVGGFLTIDGSPGAEGWARIQTETRDSTISVFFPNLSSGGYFVNGVEGRLRDGHTGFLSGNGVAAPGHQFITTYGAP